MPRRMSVWPVAIQTRTPLGMGIIARPEPSERAAAHRRPPRYRRARVCLRQVRSRSCLRRGADGSQRARMERPRLTPPRRRLDLNRQKNRTAPSPGASTRACLLQVKSKLCETPCRRATSETTAPGTRVSSTMRAFASALHRRRRSTPRTLPCITLTLRLDLRSHLSVRHPHGKAVHAGGIPSELASAEIFTLGSSAAMTVRLRRRPTPTPLNDRGALIPFGKPQRTGSDRFCT